MPGETDLDALLAGLDPVLHDEVLVFARAPVGLEVPASALKVAFAVIREDEATTVILPSRDADRIGLPYEMPSVRIELRVHSALEAVGLTAAVSRALADEDISANVIAAFHHDHVLVPVGAGDRALAALQDLATRGGAVPTHPWTRVLDLGDVQIDMRTPTGDDECRNDIVTLDVRVRVDRFGLSVRRVDFWDDTAVEELVTAMREVATARPGDHLVDGTRGLTIRFTSHGDTDPPGHSRGRVAVAVWVTPSGDDPSQSAMFDTWAPPADFAAAAERASALLAMVRGQIS